MYSLRVRTVLLAICLLGSLQYSLSQNSVTFQVDMSIKILQGSFRPDLGDVVSLRGTLNGIAVTYDLSDPNSDNIYTLTLSLPEGVLSYIYKKTLRQTEGSEVLGDPFSPAYGQRTYTVTAGTQVVPVVYYNNLSTYSPLVFHSVTIQLDMSVYTAKGLFNPATDTLVVRGDFNNFQISSAMTPVGGGVFQKTLSLVEGDAYHYRFWRSTAGATNNGWESWGGVEVSYGDRMLVVGTSDQVLPPAFFSNITTGQHPATEAEPNNVAGLANSLEYGDSISAEINPASDVDYYRFLALQGDTIEIHSSYVSGPDPLLQSLRLFDWSGNSYQNWSGGELLISQVIPASGDYFIRISSQDNWGDLPNGAGQEEPVRDSLSGLVQGITSTSMRGTTSPVSRDLRGPYPRQFADETTIEGWDPQGSANHKNPVNTIQANVGGYSLSLKRYVPQAPIAYGAYPRLLFSNTTTLYGELRPNGLSTTVAFEYGTSTAYGNSVTAIESPVDGLGWVQVSSPVITGLLPNTIYHVRLVVANALGTSYGYDYTFRTPNVPDHWEVVPSVTSGTNCTLTAVHFRDRSRGTIVGDPGPILATTDGGDTWVDQLGYWQNITAVSFSDNNNGLACGWGIWRTTDAGLHWNNVYNGGPWLYGICYLDASVALAVGAGGIVLRSTDAGATWQSVTSPTFEYLYAVARSGPNRATAVGSNGTIIQTTDGGVTWNFQTSGTNYSLRSVSFGDANHGYIGGTWFSLRTTDGGNSWQNMSEHMFAVHAINGTEAVGTGMYGTGDSYFTTDAGETWTVRSTGFGNYLHGLWFTDINHGFAVGDYGTILRYSALPPNSWIAILRLTDTCGSTAKLDFGLLQDATDGLDPSAGEEELPPLPPSNVFEARFILPGLPAIGSLTDVRNDTLSQASWRFTFQGECGHPFTISWDSSSLPPGTFFLKDELTGSIVNINMKQHSSCQITGLNSLLITFTREEMQDIAVTRNWNLLSIPFTPPSVAVDSLFPGNVAAFDWDGQYTACTSMTPGKGCWLKFNAPDTLSVWGRPVAVQDIPLIQGWNMIGPFDLPATVSLIVSEPSDVLSSDFFGYNKGYFTPSFLVPGRGYWVKSSQSGTLHLAGAVGKANSPAIAEGGDHPVIEIEDAAGAKASLSLRAAKEMGPIERYEMPPMPPAGIFDARFATNSSTEPIGKGIHEIALSSAVAPLKIKALHISQLVSLRLKDAHGTGAFDQSLLEGNTVTINGNVSRLLLEESSKAEEIPSEFSLGQNYPNPFNPTTVIRFGLPVSSQVHLTVYNLLGQSVKNLVQGTYEAGYHSVEFDAQGLASGTYFYRIQAGTFTAIKKMLVLK